MNYLKKLIDSESNESSKRFIALIAVVQLLIAINYSIFAKVVVDSNIYYILVSLIIGSSALTLFKKNV